MYANPIVRCSMVAAERRLGTRDAGGRASAKDRLSEIDRAIDRAVHDLYRLTPAEIAKVEASVPDWFH